MNRNILPIATAALLLAPCLASAQDAPEAPEAAAPDMPVPEMPVPATPSLPTVPPEAVEFLESAYLPALFADDIPAAIALTDTRGFRQYLLEQRLDDVRNANPTLSAEELEALSIYYQTNNLAPANLNAALAESLAQLKAGGATSPRIDISPAPPPFEDACLAKVHATAPDGTPRAFLVGLKLLGDRWVVAPEIPTALSLHAARQTRSALLPEDAEVILYAFCNACTFAAPESAYALCSPEYRSGKSLDAFIASFRALSARIGAPTSWSLAATRRLAPDRYGVGVNFSGTRGMSPSILVFRLAGRAWVLADVSFAPPPNFSVAPGASGASAPAAPRPAPATFHLNLSNAPAATDSFPGKNPDDPANSFFKGLSGKAGPDKPVGPDAP